MPTTLDTILGQVNSDDIKEISQQLGIDPSSASQAIGAALPALIGALSHATRDPSKLDQLTSAVESQDAGILDQLSRMFKSLLQSSSGGTEGSSSEGLLTDILGDHKDRVERGVRETAGLSNDKTSRLIKLLSPLVLGAIAKQLHGSEVSSEAVQKQLQQDRAAINSHHGDILGKLFDQDNDGDFDMSDVAKVVMSKMVTS